MKTIVLQSFRRHDVPAWIDACIASVRAWAAAAGWAYEFMDDAFLALPPAWARRRCADNLYALTDLGRLIWAGRMLAAGWERVVWADADILIFGAKGPQLEAGRGHGFARELFLHVDDAGISTRLHGLNNALMFFERGDPMPGALLAASYDSLRALPPGPVPRTALGPALLTQLSPTAGLNGIDGVGLFGVALMRQIAQGGGALTREYLRHSPTLPVAANLCHFQRNATPVDLHPLFDQLYADALVRLCQTHGAVLAGDPAIV